MNVTLLENRVFADYRGKMRLLGWTLIQRDWYPYLKVKFRHRERHTQKESAM